MGQIAAPVRWVLAGLAACVFLPPLAGAQSLVHEADLADTEGGRWGISVRTLDGSSVANINADRRLTPASTLKLLTTAAAFHYLGEFENAGWPAGTALYLLQDPASPHPSLIIEGTGDATLSDGPGCEASCLSGLAAAVLARGITSLQDIIVDDSLFQRPHWPDGWPQDDLRFAYGTAISALSVNDATARAEISPGGALGASPVLTWKEPPAFAVETSEAVTTPYGFELDFFRHPGADAGEIRGTIGRHTGSVQLNFGLNDPARHAGRLLAAKLKARGITVHGGVQRRDEGAPAAISGFRPQLIHRQPRPDPRMTLEEILRESNNFHSEVLLHHVSLTLGDRSTEAGLELMGHVLLEAGAEETGFNLADGSGLSVYNRITPEAMTGLLVWARAQDWFDTWSGLIPAKGEEGPVAGRPDASVPNGPIRAKSGTLFGANGLAGYFTADSGREYAFAIYINDSALSHDDARRHIDALLKTMIETF